MNILTDILSLIRRKQYVSQALPEDVIVLGVHTEPEIEGIASPIPYKNVKLIKIKDFVEQNECLPVNVPIGGLGSGVFRDKTIDPLTDECYINFRRLKSLSLNLIINESLDNNFVEFNCIAELNTASNVGGGSEVFKQKVGEDLEFRTLTSIDNSVTITEGPDTIDFATPGSSGYGVWSISDALGLRTYYPTITDALAAAVALDTIHLHANVTETSVTVILVDRVNIDFNGFSYLYTNPDTSSAFTDDGNQVRTNLFNGLIYRAGSPLGDETNTACIEMLSKSSALFSKNTEYISTETWAVITHCYTEGVIAYGYYGGIALSDYVEIKDCIGKGINQSGIKVFGAIKEGTMFNCKGYSSSGPQQHAGIHSEFANMKVSNCFGYCASLGDGVFLGNCESTSITGISNGGSGVVINGRNCTSITGKTYSNEIPDTNLIAGVVLNDVESATNINGTSEGLDIPGIAIGQYQSGLFGSPSVVLNANGKGKNIGCSIYQTLGGDGTANKLMIQNSSFHAESLNNAVACTIEKNQNFGNRINILNSSFTTREANAIGIEGIGVVAQVRYSNCSFAFGLDSIGNNPTTVNVTQLITNTQDNQGNILL